MKSDLGQYVIKGKMLEAEVEDTILEIFYNMPFGVLKEEHVKGCSGKIWRPDFVILTKPFNKIIAILECKGIGKPKSWQYHAQMCSAYVELNDLRLNPEISSAKYYLIVNRPPERGDQTVSKIDYRKMFGCINVKVYYRTDLEEEDWKSFLEEFFEIRDKY
jgi:hypothetical protein